MLFLIKTEFQKYILNKKVLIVGILTLAFFLFQIITMGASNYSEFPLDQKLEYATTIEKVKSQSYPATEINEDFKASLLEEYKVYVDENMQSKEEIQAFIEKFELNDNVDDVLNHKYDYSYSGLVFSDDIKYGDNLLTNYFAGKYADVRTIERLQEEIDNKFYYEEYNYQEYDYYTKEQRNDMIDLMQKNILDKPYVRGYALGWDFLSSNMQFLPFTLGILLLVSLYNMFGAEKIKKTDSIILTSKEGKRKYIFAKLLTVFIYASALWVMFQLINLIACQLLFTLEGANVSVYASPFNSVYGYNYLEYVLHQLPVSYLGTLLVAYIISFASQLIRPIPTLTIGSIWILLTSWVVYSQRSTGYSLSSKLMLLSPTQMMSSFSTYSEYMPYNILGININLPSLTYIILFFGLFFSIIGLYFITRNRQIKG